MTKPTHPTIETVTVTPKLATHWLSFNTGNRRAKPRSVSQMAQSMTRKEWLLNGETIKFAGTPTSPKKLLDGQNRLYGVIEADVPVQMHVAWGVAEAAQDTMDVGVKRSTADALSLAGEKYATTLASTVSWWWRNNNNARGSTTAPTIPEARRILADHPGLRDAVATVMRDNNIRFPGALAAFLLYELSYIDPDDADVFFHKLLSGVGLQGEGDPIYVLHRVVAADSLQRPRMSNTRLWAITIKAWNAWRDGTEVKLLRFSPGGAHPEAWPVPR